MGANMRDGFWRSKVPHLGLLMICTIILSIAGSGSDYPMTITDSAGREVTLQMPVAEDNSH